LYTSYVALWFLMNFDYLYIKYIFIEDTFPHWC